jgi:hypothetical protein
MSFKPLIYQALGLIQQALIRKNQLAAKTYDQVIS